MTTDTCKLAPARATRAARAARATCAAIGLLIASTAAAPAQGFDYRLPASEYGKVSLAAKQSLGSATRLVTDQKNVFEPMSLLRKDDPLRRLTRAVGRLDLLIEEDGEQFMSSCTGTIVNDGEAVLTARHCIPGVTGKVVEASILLDYYDADSDTIRLNVDTEPMASDPGLDYSLVRLLDEVPADIPPVSIARSDVLPDDRLVIVHHPAGLAKKMTQYGCRAASSLSPQTNLRHRCDTLPGSSGAPIFNGNREIVGTHHTGGMTSDDPNSFNSGTRILSILKNTDLLITPADATDPRAGQAVSVSAPAGEPTATGETAKPGANTLIEAIGGGDSEAATAAAGASNDEEMNEIIEGNQ